MAKLMAEIGRTGLQHNAGNITEEYDPDLRGQRGVKVFDEMRKSNPTVRGALRLIKWVLLQVPWTVQPGGESAADKKAAEFLDTCMGDMSHTWSRFLSNSLTMLDFGWSWFEVVYKPRAGDSSRYDDGRIGWRKLVMVGQDSLDRWALEADGSIAGLWQRSSFDGTAYKPEVLIPLQKSVLFRLDEEKNNPEGESLLRSAYLPWYMLKNLQEIEAIGIERDLTGVLIIKLPVNATQADFEKGRDLLEQYKADDMTGFIAPQFGAEPHLNWGFEIINSPGSKSIDVDKAIQRYKTDIARSFLAQFLMLGGDGAGSWALSKDQTDMFSVSLGAILQNLEETINRHLVVPLFKLNDFGRLTALPQLRPGAIGRSDVSKLAAALSQLTTAGILSPDMGIEKFIREELSLPPLTVEGEERWQKREDAAEAGMAALAKAKDDEKPEEETGEDEAEAKTQEPKQEPKKQAEPDEGDYPDPPLLDPDDDEGWEELEKESTKRIERWLQMHQGPGLRWFRGPRGIDYEKAITKATDEFRGRMQNLAEQLREGSITHDAWVYRSKVEISGHVASGYRLGVAQAKGVAPSKVKLSNEQRTKMNEQVKSQYKYFNKFAKDVDGKLAAGEELTTAVDARARLYGGAVRSTAAHGQMNESGDRAMRWVRHKDDSCPTCLEMDGQVMSANAWLDGGVLPSSGTDCDGNCGCALQPAD